MLFSRSYWRLSLSNILRGFAYRMYDIYRKHVEKKLPLYDFEVVSIIRRLPTDAVCIDIGVNEAQLFRAMVQHCKKGKVYGFEPIPELYRFLEKKFSSDKVQLYPHALSDTEKEVSFYYFPNRSGVSGLSRRQTLFPESETKELRLQTCVLDKMLNLDRIDLIKIDVEGSELNVLQGAKNLIIKCRPIVVFECQSQGLDYFDTTPEQVFEFFRNLGYGISLTRYFLQDLPPMDKEMLVKLAKHRYEYQFVAWPDALSTKIA